VLDSRLIVVRLEPETTANIAILAPRRQDTILTPEIISGQRRQSRVAPSSVFFPLFAIRWRAQAMVVAQWRTTF